MQRGQDRLSSTGNGGNGVRVVDGSGGWAREYRSDETRRRKVAMAPDIMDDHSGCDEQSPEGIAMSPLSTSSSQISHRCMPMNAGYPGRT
jgi:hypothetical protein